MLCDTHCNSQVRESVQMLANCFSLEDLKDAPYTQKGTPRKYSHWNHPSSKWTRETKSNMRWLLDHALELEHQRRLRGYNPHFVSSFLSWTAANFSKAQVPDGPLTEFAVAISDDKKCRAFAYFNSLPTIEKYRLYYILDKPFAKWKLDNAPDWYMKSIYRDNNQTFRREYECQFVP